MATRTFFGRAVQVDQVDTITIANTWATADDVVLTINGKDITLIVGTDTSTAQVATALKEMINGDTQTGTGDHTFSTTGNLVGEFSRLTAEVSGSVVTITANSEDEGRPFTLSVTETTAGDGSATETTATAATGPHHWDNADNWSGDTVPVDGDTVVFNQGNTDLLYALATSIQPAELVIEPTYTGNIGLPKINEDNSSLPYDEYLETELTFANDAGTAALAAEIDSASRRINIDFADCATVTCNVRNTGQPFDASVPPLLLTNTATDMILNILKGNVGLAIYEGESGHLATLKTGYLTNERGDVQLRAGSGVDLANAAIEIEGGVVSLDSATGSGTIIVAAGELTLLSGAHAAIDVDGGTLYYRSTGTITSLDIGNKATVDFRRDSRARTVSACDTHGAVSIYDPFKTVTWSAGIDFNHSRPADSTLDFGAHVRLTPGAVS